MLYFKRGLLVRDIRERMERLAAELEYYGFFDIGTIRRIESDTQFPSNETFLRIMNELGAPVDGFLYPLLDDQHPETLIMRDSLIQALDMSDADKAVRLLEKLESKIGFGNSDINRQLILSQRAKLYERQGKHPDDILPLLNEGMKLTFENFDENKLQRRILLFEEAEILHTMALLKARSGDLHAAIRLLDVTQKSVSSLAADERGKERKLAPVLLTLSELHMRTDDFEATLETAQKGADFSAARFSGKLNPHFTFVKAQANKGLHRDEKETGRLLHVSYFSHLLSGNTQEAEAVLSASERDFGFKMNTYGADLLAPAKQVPYSRGNPVDCKSLGEMIRIRRREARVSVKDLAMGVCDKSTLSRIENGKLEQGNIFHIEYIMQRLGIRVDPYHIFFLSSDEFRAKEIRDRVMVLLGFGRYSEAGELIEELRKDKIYKKYFSKNVNLQAIKLAEATMANTEGNPLKPEFPKLLLDALHITCPHFDEHNCGRYPLAYTFYEAVLINQLAGYYGSQGDYDRALGLYESLSRNMEINYVDEIEKGRMYAAVLFNYSTFLGRSGQREKSLAVINKGIEFAQSRKQLIDLPGLAFNKAFILHETGERENSVPWFIMSYYGSMLFAEYGQGSSVPIIASTIKERLGIDLDV